MFLITFVFVIEIRKHAGLDKGCFAKRTPKIFMYCQGKKKKVSNELDPSCYLLSCLYFIKVINHYNVIYK